MELNKLEDIIEKQMTDIYGDKVVRVKTRGVYNLNGGKEKDYNSILCHDIVGYNDMQIAVRDYLTIIDKKLFNTCVGFSYSDGTIYLTMDKEWSYGEKDMLINEALCDNELIDAINSGKVLLKISNFEPTEILECLYRIGIRRPLRQIKGTNTWCVI